MPAGGIPLASTPTPRRQTPIASFVKNPSAHPPNFHRSCNPGTPCLPCQREAGVPLASAPTPRMQTPRAPSSTPRNGLPASKPPTPPSSKKGRLTTRRISHHSRNPGPLPPLSKGGRAPRLHTHAPPANAHRHLRQKTACSPAESPPTPVTPAPLPPLSKGGGGLARRWDSSRFRTHAPPANAQRHLRQKPPPTRRISPSPAASSNPGTPCLPCQREAGPPAVAPTPRQQTPRTP